MIQQLLNIIAPDDCLQCGAEGSIWCEWCRLQFEPLPSRCFRCHAITRDFAVCASCRSTVQLSHVAVAAEYEGLAKQLITKLKFDCGRQVAHVLGVTIAEALPYFEPDTVVVNVPTAPQRWRQRGFDHTQLIAKEVAQCKGLTFDPILVRTNNSRQVGADKKTRLIQAKDSYRLKNGQNLKGKKIILIDDIVTTGASLHAAAKVLKTAGAKSIYAAAFAYSGISK